MGSAHPEETKLFLKRCALFRWLPEQLISTIAAKADTVSAKKGELVYRASEPALFIYALKSGRAQAMKTTDRSVSTRIIPIEPFMVAGEIAAIGIPKPYGQDLVAIADSEFVKVSADSILTAFNIDPTLRESTWRAFSLYACETFFKSQDDFRDIDPQGRQNWVLDYTLAIVRRSETVLVPKGVIFAFLAHGTAGIDGVEYTENCLIKVTKGQGLSALSDFCAVMWLNERAETPEEAKEVKEDPEETRMPLKLPRKHVRFRASTTDIAYIDLEDREAFSPESVALIIDESALGGCGLVLYRSIAIKVGQKCQIKLGALAPMRAEAVWRRPVDRDLVRIGFRFF